MGFIFFQMKKSMMRKHVSEPWYSRLVSGEKVIEGRLGKAEFRLLRPGDRIVFWNGDQEHAFTVLRTIPYRSFREMLMGEGLDRVLPGIHSVDEGVALYRQFYSPMDEGAFGVLAIEIQ